MRWTIISLLALSLFPIAAQPQSFGVFPGQNLGAIPDGASPCPSFGQPRDVEFFVSGLQGALESVDVTFDVTHSWVGDLDVQLIAPDGTAHVLFSRVETTSSICFGDSSNLSGSYTFNDVGNGTNFWDAAFLASGTDEIVPAGTYRSTEPGPNDNPPAPETSIVDAFSGLSDVNGTWILRFRDANADDAGAVASASLSLTAIPGCNQLRVSSQADLSSVRYEACERLEVGPAYIAGPGAQTRLSGGESVSFDGEIQIDFGAEMDVRVCGQSLCLPSTSPMPEGCHSCVTNICATSPGCCLDAWNSQCSDQVESTCGLVCE